jgi:hypothetical protein
MLTILANRYYYQKPSRELKLAKKVIVLDPSDYSSPNEFYEAMRVWFEELDFRVQAPLPSQSVLRQWGLIP